MKGRILGWFVWFVFVVVVDDDDNHIPISWKPPPVQKEYVWEERHHLRRRNQRPFEPGCRLVSQSARYARRPDDISKRSSDRVSRKGKLYTFIILSRKEKMSPIFSPSSLPVITSGGISSKYREKRPGWDEPSVLPARECRQLQRRACGAEFKRTKLKGGFGQMIA